MAKHLWIPMLAAGALSLMLSESARSAEFTWTGATDGNWNTGANWTGGVPAGAVDTSVIFSNTTQPATANDIPGGLTLNALIFEAASGTRSISGNQLIFGGAAPTIVQSA